MLKNIRKEKRLSMDETAALLTEHGADIKSRFAVWWLETHGTDSILQLQAYAKIARVPPSRLMTLAEEAKQRQAQLNQQPADLAPL